MTTVPSGRKLPSPDRDLQYCPRSDERTDKHAVAGGALLFRRCQLAAVMPTAVAVA
jgi:hypothetical protein